MKEHAHHPTEIATVVFLLDNNRIVLAPKKQDVHKKGGESLSESVRTLNGYGGKKEEGDASIRDTAIRELEEESTVQAKPENLLPAGRLRFYWPHNSSPSPDMDVYFFFLATWVGKPQSTSQMDEPEIFSVEAIPYDRMLPADRLFLPRLLSGEKLVADVYFGKKDAQGLPTMVIAQEELVV